MATWALELDGIGFYYHKKEILRGISLTAEPGAILCLLGPSGSGKTTLLHIIAGLLRQKIGRVFIRGINQFDQPTCRRDIGFVFQHPTALFPHLNVHDNVAFPFTHGGKQLRGADWKKAVAGILHITELEAYAKTSLARLSGGLKQRVALARAIVYRPSLLLLDEPLNSLDDLLKRRMLELLKNVHEEFGTTFVYVTHDVREVREIATHVVVLDDKDKSLFQFGTVHEVMNRPLDARIAEIVGGWNVLEVSRSPTAPDGVKITNELFLSASPSPTGPGKKIGLPIWSTLFVCEQRDIPDGQPIIPVQVVRSAVRYRGLRVDVRVGNHARIAAWTDAQSLTCGQGFITFRLEDLHEFQSE